MKKLLIILISLLLCGVCHAGTLSYPNYPFESEGRVTDQRLNNILNAISNVLNGGLDNDNADTTSGFRFVEIVNSLPAAGNEGRVVFNTDDNTLYFDDGSSLIAVAVLANTQTFTGANTFTGSTTLGVVTTVDINGGTIGGVTLDGTIGMSIGSDADGDIYYRSSNNLTRLGKGTAYQVLRMNSGATAPEWAAGSNIDIVTEDGNWTAPAGITKVYINMVGAGGGSAGGDGAGNGGGGGGGGAIILNYPYTVTGGNTYVVQVGVGGAGGAAGANDGNDGETTCFDTGGGNICVNGGSKGIHNGAGGAGGVGGTGNASGATGGGIMNLGGGAGAAEAAAQGGGGGGTYFGVGATAGGATSAGVAGTANTGGGAAGAGGNVSAQAGAAGGSGVVIIMY